MIHHVALDDSFRRAEGWVTADRIIPEELAREDAGSAGAGVVFGFILVAIWWFGLGCGVLLHAVLT